MQRGQDLVNNSKLGGEQKTKVLAAIGAYGQENDKNGVTVGVSGNLGSNRGATTELKDDGTIAAKFKAGREGVKLIVDIAHEGQHVSDADAFLASGAKAGDPTDLTHRDRELRAYEVSSFAAQAVGLGSTPGGIEEKYMVWSKGWKKADIERNRSKGIERLVSSSYVGYPATTPGNTYSQEFHPKR